jgi:V8-like Glu-specific endopeptidase
VPLEVDSGLVSNPGNEAESVYQVVVGDAEATWLRIFFGGSTRLEPGDRIRITSLLDGSTQHLSAETLAEWSNSTAYFNGSQVKIEVLAEPGASGSRVTVRQLFAGIDAAAGTESICGSDDRMLSSDPRAGRLLSGGCTGWLINECFLSAGHCILINDIVQFNVPLSSGSGALNHPPPSDQYMIDTSSRQWVDGGIGNDWGYFGALPNSETGLTPFEAQGARYVLASNVPSVKTQTITITGYGTDSTPPEHTQVQQTNSGPYRNFVGTTVQYEVDTTGGNSGSAVEDLSGGRAVGIHSHAGCDSAPPPYNSRTALNNFGLQLALRNPQGVCANQPACNDNGICEAGEDCFNCVTDCGYNAANSSGEAACGDDVCDLGAGEDCSNCPQDCNSRRNGPPSGRFCCGDGVDCSDSRCTGNGNSCVAASGEPEGYCCGDGACENAEDASNCAVDCSVGCSVPADCDDLNECTVGECNGGACQYTPLADDTPCEMGVCCGASCETIVCLVDGDCDDSDACTADTCSNGGTCTAACDNSSPACGLADGCCGPACNSINDPDCTCVPTHSKEKGPRCNDGIDNDCDGLTDGADPDC